MAALLGVWTSVTTISSFTAKVTVGETIPVGSKMILTMNRTITSGAVTGDESVTDESGNTWSMDAASVRSSTHDIQIWSADVVNEIEVGSEITVDWGGTSNRKVLVVSAWSEVGSRLASSGRSVGSIGSVSVGANGSSSTPSATASPAAKGLVIGATSFAGGSTFSVAGILVGSATTLVGSADRGVAQQYRTSEVVATQTITTTLPSSQGWAAAAAVYELSEAPEPPSTGFSVWDGTAEVPLTVSVWDGEAEIPLTASVT